MDPILVAYSGNVAVIRLNRPKALNALNAALMQDLLWALQQFDNDPEVGAVVITGNDRVFCGKLFTSMPMTVFPIRSSAGADIKELQLLDFAKAYAINFLQPLNRGVAAVRKPVIAAVNGFAVS
jgi:enoyl-CoA hydratase/carnithine racemase